MSGKAPMERYFGITARKSSVRTEVLAGVTTYTAMSYIILVNPAVLGTTGMNEGAVLVATCLASAVATLFMAFAANYPIALAPGMGQNFFFALTVCGPVAMGGYGFDWREGLAAVVLAGIVFVLFSLWRLRALIIGWVPDHLKRSMGVGIGFLIAMVGLRWGGLLEATPGLHVGLGDLGSAPALLTLFGLVLSATLTARGVSAALVLGVLATTGLAVAFGVKSFDGGIVGLPSGIGETLLAADFRGLFQRPEFLSVVFVILFVDLFDTVGTLVGVSERAGLSRDGELPKAREAFLADAVGSVAAGFLGTSTVTSYVESAAGVSAGGRTGLASVVTALLLAGSVFFYPLLRLVGGGVDDGSGTGTLLYPTLAPALILVGVFMMAGVSSIDWTTPRSAAPAFLTVIMMPLTTSITEGIAFGFIATAILYPASGKGHELHPAVYVIAALFLARFVWL